MTELLRVDTRADLQAALKSLDSSVPKRSEGRRAEHTERFCIAHLLATLPHAYISFPLVVLHEDKPDFVLSMPSCSIGIEHTEAVAENVARAQFLREKGHGPDAYFAPHAVPGEARKTMTELLEEIERDEAGDGWVGDSGELWSKAMAHYAERKIAKAASFRRYEKNWLLIYDNLFLPGLRIGTAAVRLSL